MTAGITVDAGGFIALIATTGGLSCCWPGPAEAGARVTVPASALAQAIRRPERQVRLVRLVRQPGTDVVALDRVDATSIGRLLAASGTSDIADAHGVICARRSGQHVITADPDDLRRLDPDLGVVVI